MKRIKLSIKKQEPAPSRLKLGLIGGRYKPREQIGRGGAGEVMLAYDTQLERLVAVKRIHLKAGESERRAAIAMDEAKRLAKLQHPNIVTVHDVLVHRREVILVMEYLSGHTLEAREEPLTMTDFGEVARQCLDALVAAHAEGMVHLDIKATNIMLTMLATGRLQVKLLDFGLAAMLENPAATLLLPGAELRGSVYTIAPEQLERKPVGVRTDLYALGCVFYHGLTRREPFQGVSVAGVIEAHLRHEYRPLGERRPDLPPGVCAWVESLMSREPEDRPASAAEALAGLEWLLPSPGEAAEMPAAGLLVEEIQASERGRLQVAFGRTVAVSGTVGKVWENGPGTLRFLNFEEVPHDDFSVVLSLKAGLGQTGRALAEALVGRKIRVVGRVTDYHGNPQIVVESPSQIGELKN
jgi:serine/threonine protein kinase